MTVLARIVQAEPIGEMQLRLTFSDGLVRELDLDGLLSGGIFDNLRDPKVFACVNVDPIAGTIYWPGGIDLDPDVLHGDHAPASGKAPRVIREYRLQPAS